MVFVDGLDMRWRRYEEVRKREELRMIFRLLVWISNWMVEVIIIYRNGKDWERVGNYDFSFGDVKVWYIC